MPKGFAVPLRVGLPEVARNLLLGAAPLLVPDDDDRPPAKAGETGDDGRVVAEAAVAVKLDEVREDPIDVVERVRAVRVPGELHLLPRRQIREELARELARLVFEPPELRLERAVASRELA